MINDTEYRNQLADAESEFSDERAGEIIFTLTVIMKLFLCSARKRSQRVVGAHRQFSRGETAAVGGECAVDE